MMAPAACCPTLAALPAGACSSHRPRCARPAPHTCPQAACAQDRFTVFVEAPKPDERYYSCRQKGNHHYNKLVGGACCALQWRCFKGAAGCHWS